MCGIVGIANSGMGKVDRDTVMTMNKLISRRGPDDEGYYWGDGVGLGMNVLPLSISKQDGNLSTMKIRPYGLSLTEKSTITVSCVSN